VKLAARVDRHAHGHLAAYRLEMMVVQLRAQHEIACLGPYRLGTTFDVPVDLTAQHHPPLVVLVVVRVVGRTWRMEDDERLNVVAQHKRRRPGSLAGTRGWVRLKLVQPSV